MAIQQELSKPTRLMTYLNENNDKRVVEWVIDTVSDSSVLTNWDNVVDLGSVDVDTVMTIANTDLAVEKEFTITADSSGGNVSWNVSTGIMNKGALCTMDSKPAILITSLAEFNMSDLTIYKNGVLLRKGIDISYSAANTLILTNDVEIGDWLKIIKIVV